jgi:hypothetical protein
MRIGVVGEYPTDIFSICLLLTQKHSFDFFPLLKRVHGSQLDQNENTALKNQLRREFQFEKPNIVLFVRDLDAVTSSANYKKNIRSRRAFSWSIYMSWKHSYWPTWKLLMHVTKPI